MFTSYTYRVKGGQDDSFSSPPFHFSLMFTSYRVKGGQDDYFFSLPFHFCLMFTRYTSIVIMIRFVLVSCSKLFSRIP